MSSTIGDSENKGPRLKSPEANQCLSEELAEQYLAGHLDEPAMEAVEAHIALCEPCLLLLEKEERFRQDLESAVHILEQDQRPDKLRHHDHRTAAWWERWIPRHRNRWALAMAIPALAIAVAIFAPNAVREPQFQTVALVTMRGDVTSAKAAPGTPLLLRADLQGLGVTGSLRMLVVDATGGIVESQMAPVVEQYASLRLKTGLPSGAYWVRAVDPADPASVLREFALQVR